MSAEYKDGGPAFPSKKQVHRMGYATNEWVPVNGMTLRDYFAAKAMQGMLADLPKTLYGLDWQINVARASYEVADAMLKERAA